MFWSVNFQAFQVFPWLTKRFWIYEFCPSWTSQFFLIDEKDKKNCFFYISRDCVSNFSQFKKELEKLGLFMSPLIHILWNCEDSISGMICLYEREVNPVFNKTASFPEKEMFTFIKQFFVSLSSANTDSKIKWE